MELLEAIEARHSVRSYSDQKIEGNVLEALRQRITRCNQQSGCTSSCALKNRRPLAV